jgi:hypothetical protein
MPDWWSAAEIVVLLEGSPISTEELSSSFRVTIGFLVTSPTKALLPRLLSLAGRPALGRVLVVLKFFHLRMMEATVFFGTFNAAEIFWYPSPDLCLDTFLSQSSTDNSFDIMAMFLCTVYCGTIYRQVFAVTNHVQSTEFTTGGVQTICINISRMINGNKLHLSSISSHIAKGLNTFFGNTIGKNV